MRRRILSLLLVLMLCAALACTAYAQAGHIYDNADLLTDSEESALTEKLSQLSDANEAQIVIFTVDSTGGKGERAYLNDLYDEMSFGYGEDRSAVLLLVCMDEREYYILSKGYADTAIDADAIGEQFESDLTDGDYADAFHTFAEETDYYLNGYRNGFPFDVGFHLVIALAVGLVIALIVTGIWRGQLKSVRQKNEANAYVKAGSMQITQSGDYFMYRNVTRRAKPKNNASSGSRGGSSRGSGGGSF